MSKAAKPRGVKCLNQEHQVFRFGENAWKNCLQQKRKKGSLNYTIKKDVASALMMRKGQPLWAYTAEELNSKRKVIILFTDGKERDGHSEDLDEWRREGGGDYAERKVGKK